MHKKVKPKECTLESTFLKNLGRNIQIFRTAQKLTIRQLSEKTKIREQYLKKIEAGEAVRMTTEHLFLIAEALQVKVHYLENFPNDEL